MILLDGVRLSLPTREILTAIKRDISLEKMLLLFNRSWPGPGMVFLAQPTHHRPWPPWHTPGSLLNRFHWPTGASRFGVGAFLATKQQCDDIHDDCFGVNGDESNEVKLTLTSEDSNGVTTETADIDFITVFPPIPLYRVANDDGSTDYGMYLILLVETRYYWWQATCPDFGITETSGTTWQDLIDKIGDELELTITVDGAIPTEYLLPHRALNLTGEPIPPVLDAIAYNLGARVVVTYAGDVSIQRFQEGLDKFNQDFDDHPDRQQRSGDFKFIDLF